METATFFLREADNVHYRNESIRFTRSYNHHNMKKHCKYWQTGHDKLFLQHARAGKVVVLWSISEIREVNSGHEIQK